MEYIKLTRDDVFQKGDERVSSVNLDTGEITWKPILDTLVGTSNYYYRFTARRPIINYHPVSVF